MRRFAAAFVFVALSASLAATPAAFAQERVAPPPPAMSGPPPIEGAVLTVNAEGKVTGRPDMATVQLGVVTEAPTAQAALAANAQRMNALMAALRRAGIAERDVQTSNLSVNPQYVYAEREPPRLTGYQAQNTVSAKVRNLDRLGATLDAAIAAGGNTLNGVSFSYQNPDAQMDRARSDAIGEARRRAALYAQAAGLRVHRILAISESGSYAPPIPMPMMARMEVAAQAAPTPTAPGEIDTIANVSVTFELR